MPCICAIAFRLWFARGKWIQLCKAVWAEMVLSLLHYKFGKLNLHRYFCICHKQLHSICIRYWTGYVKLPSLDTLCSCFCNAISKIKIKLGLVAQVEARQWKTNGGNSGNEHMKKMTNANLLLTRIRNGNGYAAGSGNAPASKNEPKCSWGSDYVGVWQRDGNSPARQNSRRMIAAAVLMARAQNVTLVQRLWWIRLRRRGPDLLSSGLESRLRQLLSNDNRAARNRKSRCQTKCTSLCDAVALA